MAAAKRKLPARSGATRRKRLPATKPRLLSGGNPQIPKWHGPGPVRAYIAALPGWKRAVVRKLDALITRAVPGVRKAVKWNSPLYGRDVQSWFLAIHAFDRFIKVTFMRGTMLRPLPPVPSKMATVRYLHVDATSLDATQFSRWVRQASRLPGQKM